MAVNLKSVYIKNYSSTSSLRNSLLAKLWNEKERGPSHGTKTYTRLDDVPLLSSSLKTVELQCMSALLLLFFPYIDFVPKR
jgi:hypothetical protein